MIEYQFCTECQHFHIIELSQRSYLEDRKQYEMPTHISQVKKSKYLNQQASKPRYSIAFDEQRQTPNKSTKKDQIYSKNKLTLVIEMKSASNASLKLQKENKQEIQKSIQKCHLNDYRCFSINCGSNSDLSGSQTTVSGHFRKNLRK